MSAVADLDTATAVRGREGTMPPGFLRMRPVFGPYPPLSRALAGMEIARALGMNYVFFTEFVELDSPKRSARDAVRRRRMTERACGRGEPGGNRADGVRARRMGSVWLARGIRPALPPLSLRRAAACTATPF